MEFSLADFGSIDVNGVVSGVPVTGKESAYGYDFAVVGIIPVGYKISLTGKVGFAGTHLKVEASGRASQADWSDGGFLGAGLQYDITHAISARVNYDYYGVVGSKITGKTNLSTITGGLSYTF